MGVEVMELLWQDVRVWDEIKLGSSETLLHLHVVVAKSIFPRNFVAHWEMVDALVLIEALVQVALARARRPEHIPFM